MFDAFEHFDLISQDDLLVRQDYLAVIGLEVVLCLPL
jgi:hypothetical protein